MGLSEEWERFGIKDLFTVDGEARALLPAVCKSITKQNIANKDESGEYFSNNFDGNFLLLLNSLLSRAHPAAMFL